MGKSFQLGSIAGIRLQVHWTFLLILAWVTFTSFYAGMSWTGVLMNLGFILVLFSCVLLHELGHALAARLFKIPTKDITLLPIGGVARLERMPRKPVQELVVALAGPAVNIAIALMLLAFLLPTVGLGGLAAVPMRSGGFLQQLLVINLALVAFNMLPAFPLDGGRVFRALMATVLPYATATRVAATVGQACAIGLGYLGLTNPLLLVIAVFIFFAAAAETRQVTLLERIGDYRVRDGMIRSFQAIPSDTSIGDIGPELLDSYQRDFPVIQDGRPVGMLPRDELLRAKVQGESSLIADVMQPDVPSVEESDALVVAFERASPAGGGTLLVTEGGSLTGLLDLQQVLDLANFRTRLRRATSNMPTLSPQPSGGTTT